MVNLRKRKETKMPDYHCGVVWLVCVCVVCFDFILFSFLTQIISS